MYSPLVNNVRLLGNVGTELELKETANGHRLSFSMATNASYVAANKEKVTVTDWHNCTAWNGLAESMAKHVKKGSRIVIEGELRNDNYEKDGQKVFGTKIEVNNFYILDAKTKED